MSSSLLIQVDPRTPLQTVLLRIISFYEDYVLSEKTVFLFGNQ
jgi:hypothetical protein